MLKRLRTIFFGGGTLTGPRALGGSRMNDALQSIIQHFERNGLEAVFPKRALVELLPPDAVIVDAGAHVGVDTVDFAEMMPGGTIFAFEPEPKLFKKLQENVRRFRNVRPERLALSDKVGTVRFNVSSGTSDAASSLLTPKEIKTFHPGNQFVETINVQAVSLESYLKAANVGVVDLLWLDLQGHELAVLGTMESYLPTVSVIFLEVSLAEVYEGVPLYGEARRFLEERGFQVIFEQLPWQDAGNVLAINSALVSSLI